MAGIAGLRSGPRPGPRYGVDAPPALAGIAAGAGATLTIATVLRRSARSGRRRAGGLMAIGGLVQAATAGSYLYTTLRGKVEVWEEQVAALELTGAERVLDLGCGRGMVLITVARRLTTGRVTGVDLWQARDQSGNAEAATLRNAELAGVRDRIDLMTADLRALPVPDAGVDVVLSSLAVHNIPDEQGQAQAIREAWRVLGPGGRLRVADFKHVGRYAEVLSALGAQDVAVRDLGPRFWYGGPWARTGLVSATK